MAIKRRVSGIDVVTAARIRIKNAFSNGLPVYLSFSGGKDSLCLAEITLDLINSGEIDPSLLTVIFIDEEAIFPCIERTVKKWRQKFMLVGAKFIWYCLEVKHFNCFNSLSEDESFFCWDSTRKDVWVRNIPSFAITDHPMLNKRADDYQAFLHRSCSNGVTLVGVRAYESLQRMQSFARMGEAKMRITSNRHFFPLYDWRDADMKLSPISFVDFFVILYSLINAYRSSYMRSAISRSLDFCSSTFARIANSAF